MSSEQMPQDRWCAFRGEYISVPPQEEINRRKQEEEEYRRKERRYEYPEFCCGIPVEEMLKEHKEVRHNQPLYCWSCGRTICTEVVK